MSNEEILACLIKADCCAEKAYWLIKNIPQDYAQCVGIADNLTQLLNHLDEVDSELVDIMNKLNAHGKLNNRL